MRLPPLSRLAFPSHATVARQPTNHASRNTVSPRMPSTSSTAHPLISALALLWNRLAIDDVLSPSTFRTLLHASAANDFRLARLTHHSASLAQGRNFELQSPDHPTRRRRRCTVPHLRNPTAISLWSRNPSPAFKSVQDNRLYLCKTTSPFVDVSSELRPATSLNQSRKEALSRWVR
jgi:hypothetical protein